MRAMQGLRSAAQAAARKSAARSLHRVRDLFSYPFCNSCTIDTSVSAIASRRLYGLLIVKRFHSGDLSFLLS
jgi:hypothetical protein